MEIMKIQDLRIGNIVLYNGNRCVIENIYKSEEHQHIGIDKYGPLLLEEIEPIIITDDLLKEIGFDVRNKTYSINVVSELMLYALLERITDSKRISFIIYFSKGKGWTLDSVSKTKETVFFNELHILQNIFYFLNLEEIKTTY